MSANPTLEATLRVATDVLHVLKDHGADAVLIGGMALAVHQYPRDTVDLDLAVAVAPCLLHEIAASLAARGYEAVVREPDAADPLGGVLDVRGSGADLVQVVNFLNPPTGGFPRLVADAIATATPLTPQHEIRVVDLHHLIVFKLYAGGPKSMLDILELLERNPALDLERLETLCASYRLDRKLRSVLEMAREDSGQ